jgi:hypothetical protein
MRHRDRVAMALARNGGSTTLVELVPWAGPLQDAAGERHREIARHLAADERVTALAVTDNAGGFVRLGPQTLGVDENGKPVGLF